MPWKGYQPLHYLSLLCLLVLMQMSVRLFGGWKEGVVAEGVLWLWKLRYILCMSIRRWRCCHKNFQCVWTVGFHTHFWGQATWGQVQRVPDHWWLVCWLGWPQWSFHLGCPAAIQTAIPNTLLNLILVLWPHQHWVYMHILDVIWVFTDYELNRCRMGSKVLDKGPPIL